MACLAISASTRTPTTLLLSSVNQILLPPWVFAPTIQAVSGKFTLLYHFKRMVESAGIKDLATRDIVPYSFRHYMITQRIMSGLDFHAIAGMCGTSIT